MKRIIIFSALVHAATSMENEGGLLSKFSRDLFNHTCSFLDHKSVGALATTSKKNEGRIKNYKEHVIQKFYNDVNAQNQMKNQGAYTLIHWEALLKENILLFERYTAPKEEKTHILIGLLQLCWKKKLEKLELLLREKLKEEEHKTSISDVLKKHLETIFYLKYEEYINEDDTFKIISEQSSFTKKKISSSWGKLKLLSDTTFKLNSQNDEYFNALMFALPFSTAFSLLNEEAKNFYCKDDGINGFLPFGYSFIPQCFMKKLCDFHIKKDHYLSPESFFQIFDTKKKEDDYNLYLCSFKNQAFTHMIRLNNFTELLPFYFNYSSLFCDIFIKKAEILWEKNELKEIKEEDTALIKEMAFASLWVCTKNLALAEGLINKVKNFTPYIQWTTQDNKVLLLTIFNRRFYSAIEKKSFYSNEEKEKIKEYELVNASIVEAILQSKLKGMEKLVKEILKHSSDHVNFQLLKVLLEKITNIEFFAEILKYNRINQDKDFSAYILECIKKQLLQKDVLYFNGILESEWVQDNHQLRELILSCIETLSK